jgi:hypothetical protein
MTHMDDQVAKHITEMIFKIKRKPTDNQEPPASLTRFSGSFVFSRIPTIPMT